MSDAAQNIVNALQEQQHERMNRLNALQRDARRLAFEAVVNRSWKARQDFRDVVEAADQLSDEIAMTGMALAEAHSRLQQRGRDAGEVMRELNFGGSE
jgi:ethanolamine utilization cobalamin adenosyltransferase